MPPQKSRTQKIKSGGIVIVDNINWYLPAPHKTCSPASRSRTDGPATVAWEQFSLAVDHWRSVWTTNGVWDTALWQKPLDAD